LKDRKVEGPGHKRDSQSGERRIRSEDEVEGKKTGGWAKTPLLFLLTTGEEPVIMIKPQKQEVIYHEYRSKSNNNYDIKNNAKRTETLHRTETINNGRTPRQVSQTHSITTNLLAISKRFRRRGLHQQAKPMEHNGPKQSTAQAIYDNPDKKGC